MDGLRRIQPQAQPPVAPRTSAAPEPGPQASPAPPVQPQPGPAARSLDEVFGETISMLKDLSRASMKIAQATDEATRAKAQVPTHKPRRDQSSIDTLA